MSKEKIPALDAIQQKNQEAMRKEQREAMQAYNLQLQNQGAHLGILERGLDIINSLSLSPAITPEDETRLQDIRKSVINGLHLLFVAPVSVEPATNKETSGVDNE